VTAKEANISFRKQRKPKNTENLRSLERKYFIHPAKCFTETASGLYKTQDN